MKRENKGRRGWLNKRQLASLALGTVMSLGMHSTFAQEWPVKPVRIVIAAAAGSGDVLARLLAPRLEERWKQPVIVEAKPGAGGIVGTEHVVRSTDGHTLLLGTQSSFLPKYTQKGLRFDPLTDLVPVRKVVHYQSVIAANSETVKKATTLKDLVALSKTGEGFFFGGTGPTSLFNLTFAILNQQLGMRYSTVDFNGPGAMNLALIRNDVQFAVSNPASMKGFIDNGTIVPLAVISARRYSNLPQVPTLKEAVDYDGYLPQWWAGVLMPKGTPSAVVERVNSDVTAILQDEAFRRQVETTVTATVVASSPESYARDIREETVVWEKLFKTLNIKPE